MTDHEHCRGHKTNNMPCGATKALDENGYCRFHKDQYDPDKDAPPADAETPDDGMPLPGEVPPSGPPTEATATDPQAEADPDMDENVQYTFMADDKKCPYCSSPNTSHMSTQGGVQYRKCDHAPVERGGVGHHPLCIGENGDGQKFTFKVIGIASAPTNLRMCDACGKRKPRPVFPVRSPLHICPKCWEEVIVNLAFIKKERGEA